MNPVKAELPSSKLMERTERDPAITHPATQIAQLAILPKIEDAFVWFSRHANALLESHIELARIPASPFGESARAEWLRKRFIELGLEDVHLDGIGNVLGIQPGMDASRKVVLITAHLDTVFPPDTPFTVRREGEKIYGPGVSDNAAGLTGLLAIAEVINAARIRTQAPILFVGNVGEEGEGDVRGMRYLFANPRWQNSIGCTMVLDGAGCDTVVTEALGSKRFLVTLRGPGGHSWSDYGVPNPIMVLARVLEIFRRTPIPHSPKTTFNVGVITGGTSVNSIPESVSVRIDIRSVSTEQVDRLERELRKAIELAIKEESPYTGGRRMGGLNYEMSLIGSRPAARLKPGSPMLGTLQAVDAFLGNRARLQRASTDANIPMALGYEAFAIGAGGSGGGAHTLHEWYDATGRELGLKRILLTALALAGTGE